jgi:hypothetical protein
MLLFILQVQLVHWLTEPQKKGRRFHFEELDLEVWTFFFALGYSWSSDFQNRRIVSSKPFRSPIFSRMLHLMFVSWRGSKLFLPLRRAMDAVQMVPLHVLAVFATAVSSISTS